MGIFVKTLLLVAMVTLSETRAWYAPHGQDDVAEPASSRATRRPEEDDEFAVETFAPRSGRARAPTASSTAAPATRTSPPTTAPPPRPSYDKPAPPRRVIDHSYDYPEFVAAPNPTPPIGHSYFGVDLGSLSSSEGSGNDQESQDPVPTTASPAPASPAPVDPEEDSDSARGSDRKTASQSSDVVLALQLTKMLRWPLVAVILIAVLGTCLLSGCSVGLFGRRCFDTNAHRRTVVTPAKSPVDREVSEEHLDLQTRRAIAKGNPPKNLKVTFSAVPKEGAAGENGEMEHVRVVKESDV